MSVVVRTVVLLTVIFFPANSWAQEYGIDVPYQQAVPHFWDAVGEAVSSVPGKEAIGQWAGQVSARIDEFLADALASTQAQVDKPLGSPDISEIEAFQQKWQAVLDTCPECDEVVPLVEPIVEELLSGLPVLRKTRQQDTPFQNFFEFFRELEALNPWGTAALFQLDPVAGRRHLSVSERSRETKSSGVREVFINNRIVTEVEDGETIFEEQIADDEVLEVSFSPDAVTMLHETLASLIRDGGDPDVIALLEDLTVLVDEELTAAWEAGFLDDFTYAYFFEQGLIRNELVHVKHPLMKDPFIQDFKTAEFYPRTFQDDQNETQAQTQLQDLRLSAVNRSQRIQASLDDYSKAVEKVSSFWVLGFFSSVSMFSLFGLGKSIL